MTNRVRTPLRALAACAWLACTACTTQLTGTGAEVAEQVRAAMATLPDHTDWTCRELTDAKQGFVGAGESLDPAQGQFVYILGPRHKFDDQRAVEITIRPWDERPDISRLITINAWHYGGIPPLIPKPDWSANEDCRRAIARGPAAAPEPR